MTLAVGDTVPDLSFEDVDGQRRTLAEFRAGRRLVLYFYPKDDTPGCTTEARDFTAAAPAFANLGVVVLGVSKDSRDRHRKFIDKHGLTVALAVDDSALCEAFGVWGERSLYGRTYMGIERATFAIAADGRIEHLWRKVKVARHVAEVLATLRTGFD